MPVVATDMVLPSQKALALLNRASQLNLVWQIIRVNALGTQVGF